MQTAETKQVETKTFEQRRYEAMRQSAARPVGSLAIAGYEQHLAELDRRFKDEMQSAFVESLTKRGEIDTHYPFELVDGRLVAEDGEPIGDMLVRCLRKDIKLATADNFYTFLPERSRAELDNLRLFESMARGEIDGNCVLEISVYNEELDTSEVNRNKLIAAAQKPYCGRSMIRLSYWDGKVAHLYTTSSDNLAAAKTYTKDPEDSSVARLAAVVESQTGHKFSNQTANGMLAEPIILTLDPARAKKLTKDIAAGVDSLISARHGGDWRQGRPAGESVDLDAYVNSQEEVWAGFRQTEDLLRASANNYAQYEQRLRNEMYNCIALLEMRLESGEYTRPLENYASAASGAGAIAESNGVTYDACGLVLGPNSNTAAGVAEKTGKESLMRLENKKIGCPECKAKVVVPKKDLEAGRLSCTDCGYCLDVCTGKVLSRSRAQQRGASIFDIFTETHKTYWQKKEMTKPPRKPNKKTA